MGTGDALATNPLQEVVQFTARVDKAEANLKDAKTLIAEMELLADQHDGITFAGKAQQAKLLVLAFEKDLFVLSAAELSKITPEGEMDAVEVRNALDALSDLDGTYQDLKEPVAALGAFQDYKGKAFASVVTPPVRNGAVALTLAKGAKDWSDIFIEVESWQTWAKGRTQAHYDAEKQKADLEATQGQTGDHTDIPENTFEIDPYAIDASMYKDMTKKYKSGQRLYLFHAIQDETNIAIGLVSALSGVETKGLRELKDEQQKYKPVTEQLSDLGNLKKLNGSFPRVAGGILSALVPDAGDKCKFQANVNVPVVGGSVGRGSIVKVKAQVTAGLEFITEAERADDNQIKLRAQLGFVLAGGAGLKIGGLSVADIQARVCAFGYVEACGKTGRQVFDLILLAIYKRVDSVSSTLAGKMFDGKEITEIESEMDEKDSVESGFGISASLKGKLGGKKGVEGEVSAERSGGKKITGTQGDGTNTAKTKNYKFGVSVKLDPFGLAAKLSIKYENNKWTETELEVSGKGTSSIADMKDVVLAGDFFASLWGKLGGLIAKSEGADKGGAQTAGSIVEFGTSGPGQLAAAKVVQNKLPKLAQVWKISGQLFFKLKKERGKGYSGAIGVERIGSIEYGSSEQPDPSDKFYVAVEKINRIAYKKF